MTTSSQQQRNIETKSIRVTKETYNRLAKLGDLNDSFDTVIRKLLDKHHNNNKLLNL